MDETIAEAAAEEAEEGGADEAGPSGGDTIMSEDEIDPSDFEATVPEEWQRVMSTRTLREGTPMPLDELVQTIGELIEGKVQADAAGGDSVSMPSYVWQWASTRHGSHKLAEVALASTVKGVEASWSSHTLVRLFGELCGMLKDPHDEVVNRKVLGLLAGAAALCDADAISVTLVGLGEAGTVSAAAAKAAIASLNLLDDEAEKLDNFIEGLPPRLDALLVAVVQPVRETLAELVTNSTAVEVREEVAEEQGAEEAVAEAVVDEEAAQAAANADRVTSALDWASAVAKLPIGREEKAARGAIFGSCTDAAAMGVDAARAGLLRHLQPSEPVAAILSGAIGDGFALAAEVSGDEAGEAVGRWGFLLLLAYVRRHAELLMTLDRLTQEDTERPVSADDFGAACGIAAEWGVAVEDPAAEYEAAGGNELSFPGLASWCLRRCLEAMASDGAAAEAEEAEEATEAAEAEEAVAALLPPPEPLESVFEQTERSEFSDSNLASVQKGFFDASRLEGVDEETSELRSKYEAALAELEALRGERGEQQRRMGTVLEANEAMQRQLKELNAVVEGVVKRELQRVKAANATKASRGRSPAKLGR